MDRQGELAQRDEVMSLIRRAIQAPSSHNTQPWRFRIEPDGVVLLADRTRGLPVNDPDDRELTISCGCALLNLVVAAEAAGFSPQVGIAPSGEDDEVMARVALLRSGALVSVRAALLPSIAARRTYRKAFLAREVPAGILEQLMAAARAEGAVLEVASTPAARQAIASFVAEGDACQWSNPAWRRELAMWMHPRRSGDGVVVPGLVASLAQAVVRTFDLGNGVAASDRNLSDASPVLAVLSTGGDEPRDRMLAGMALQRVLLEGVRLGLQASYLNQPVQVPWIRMRLRTSLIVPAIPQVVLRLGYPGEPVQPAPRRPLEDVLDSD